MKSAKTKVVLLFIWPILFVFISALAGDDQSTSKGSITGQVLDLETGEALPYANVSIVGATWGASTATDGNFTIANIPRRVSRLAGRNFAVVSKILS
jgi:hypothetical protein